MGTASVHCRAHSGCAMIAPWAGRPWLRTHIEIPGPALALVWPNPHGQDLAAAAGGRGRSAGRGAGCGVGGWSGRCQPASACRSSGWVGRYWQGLAPACCRWRQHARQCVVLGLGVGRRPLPAGGQHQLRHRPQLARMSSLDFVPASQDQGSEAAISLDSSPMRIYIAGYVA